MKKLNTILKAECQETLDILYKAKYKLPFIYKRYRESFKLEPYTQYIETLGKALTHYVIDDFEWVVGHINEEVTRNLYNWTAPQMYYNVIYLMEKLYPEREIPVMKTNFLQKLSFIIKASQYKNPIIKDPVVEYKNAMSWLDILSKRNMTKEQKYLFLSELENLVINDLAYSSYATLLYGESTYLTICLPSFIYEKYYKEEIVNLKDCHVISKQNHIESMLDIYRLNHKIDFDKDLSPGCEGVYVKNFNLLFVLEGKHHCARCALKKEKGEIPAKVIDIDPYINDLETDGETWSYKGRKEVVSDFRIALLFSIYKEKIKYQQLT